MKTYCKNIDITNLDFIIQCILECLEGKWKRRETAQLLSKFSDMKQAEIHQLTMNDDKSELFPIITNIAEYMRYTLIEECIKLPPIKYSERYDENSRKIRIIGKQSLIHQFYEYVAVNASKELFNKKFGTFQCASIPDRGQSYGKKAIEKWIQKDIPGTRYAVKMDVKKCYPSVNTNTLKKMLSRDIHKNPKLLYLLFSLIDMFDTGLSIGSHLSQWLCNYYLSYAYHFISEKLFIQKYSKRNKCTNNVRLISHVIFYMDDIIIFGSNKKYLMIATQRIIEYLKEQLSLRIKDDWRLFKVIYTDKSGKVHGSFVDMMGFRFYRDRTTIRRSIFLRAKRKYKKQKKLIRNKKQISEASAQSIMSYWGWIKNTNSYYAQQKYEIVMITAKAKHQVSYFAKLRNSMSNDGG